MPCPFSCSKHHLHQQHIAQCADAAYLVTGCITLVNMNEKTGIGSLRWWFFFWGQ